MYSVVRTKRFEKSFKKLKESGRLKTVARKDLENAIDLLIAGEHLSISYADHGLKGDLQDYRECHIKGDLLLIYRLIADKLVLVLVDIGSHSYLFGQ